MISGYKKRFQSTGVLKDYIINIGAYVTDREGLKWFFWCSWSLYITLRRAGCPLSYPHQQGRRRPSDRILLCVGQGVEKQASEQVWRPSCSALSRRVTTGPRPHRASSMPSRIFPANRLLLRGPRASRLLTRDRHHTLAKGMGALFWWHSFFGPFFRSQAKSGASPPPA